MKKTYVVKDSRLEVAEAFERALCNKPIEEQLAASLVAKNVFNGCSWDFCRMDPSLRRFEEEFTNSKTCSLKRVTYNRLLGIKGYLIHIEMERLFELLGPNNNGPLNVSDIEFVKQKRKETMAALLERMKSGYKGKIAIYSTNDSGIIIACGKTFPAYAVTLKELCKLCEIVGYGIVAGGKIREPRLVLEHEDDVTECLLISPSSNAVFIDIAPLDK